MSTFYHYPLFSNGETEAKIIKQPTQGQYSWQMEASGSPCRSDHPKDCVSTVTLGSLPWLLRHLSYKPQLSSCASSSLPHSLAPAWSPQRKPMGLNLPPLRISHSAFVVCSVKSRPLLLAFKVQRPPGGAHLSSPLLFQLSAEIRSLPQNPVHMPSSPRNIFWSQ